MKQLPPSIQEDARYLRFKIHADEEIKFGDAVESIWDVLLEEIGAIELSRADLWIVKNKYSKEENAGVIRINREMEDMVRSSILFLTEISDKEVFAEIEKASGMIDNL